MKWFLENVAAAFVSREQQRGQQSEEDRTSWKEKEGVNEKGRKIMMRREEESNKWGGEKKGGKEYKTSERGGMVTLKRRREGASGPDKKSERQTELGSISSHWVSNSQEPHLIYFQGIQYIY